MRALLRLFFHILYHPFAFAYDFVAGAVSRGHWREWVLEAVPFIEGRRTLEIGHGPGHLHHFLLRRGLEAVALDGSASMGLIAKQNLLKDGSSEPLDHQPDYAQTNLTRGIAQQLPFQNSAFDTVIATFPAEYIRDPRTLSEVRRCLSDGGRFVVLPAALPKDRFLSWLFRITGQAPTEAVKAVGEELEEPFHQSGFDVQTHVIDVRSAALVVIVAEAQAAVRGSPSPGTAKEAPKIEENHAQETS